MPFEPAGYLGSDYHPRTAELPPEDRRIARERSWQARGIPERMWPALHDGAPDEPAVGPLAARPTPALDAASRFLGPTDMATFLVLSGPVGTGKSFGAVWAAAWNGGRFVAAIDLLRAGLYPADPAFWPQLRFCSALVVDDLGVEPLDKGGFGLTALESLISARYDGRRKTILTTNLTPADVKARLGERVWRRITEAGRWVNLAEVVQ